VLQADPKSAEGSSFTRVCWTSSSSQCGEGGTRGDWEAEGKSS